MKNSLNRYEWNLKTLKNSYFATNVLQHRNATNKTFRIIKQLDFIIYDLPIKISSELNK